MLNNASNISSPPKLKDEENLVEDIFSDEENITNENDKPKQYSAE